MVVKQRALARLRKQRSHLDRAIRALEQFEIMVARQAEDPSGGERSQESSPARIGSRSPSKKAVLVYFDRPLRGQS